MVQLFPVTPLMYCVLESISGLIYYTERADYDSGLVDASTWRLFTIPTIKGSFRASIDPTVIPIEINNLNPARRSLISYRRNRQDHGARVLRGALFTSKPLGVPTTNYCLHVSLSQPPNKKTELEAAINWLGDLVCREYHRLYAESLLQSL